MRLLEKYGFTDYLESFRIRRVFPSKSVWKRMVKQRIRQYETVQWQNRIGDADFFYFFICRLDKTSQTLFLLGENNVQISEYLGAEISRCYDLCAVSLHRMWSKIYNRLI